VIFLSSSINPFEFVKIAALRAGQLMLGCTARVSGGHTVVVTAQLEVLAGKVQAAPAADSVVALPTTD
jgi:hypothetical protein